MTLVYSASASGTAAEAAVSLRNEIEENCPDPDLVMVFSSVEQPIAELLPSLASAFPDAVVLGASTAGEFTENGDTQGQAAAVAISGDFTVSGGFGNGLAADPHAAVSAALEGQPRSVEGKPHKTAFLLLDTLGGNGEEASLIASHLLGGDVRLAGGAAGDDDMTSTWVGAGDRVGTDAVSIAVLHSAQPLGIGVDHGHAPLSEQVTVTRSEGGVVYEVDGQPAWDVWREKTREAAARRGVDVDNLSEAGEIFEHLVVYEAGLSIGDNFKMRAPLFRNDDGSLTFACGIPEGAVIRIMEGRPDAQIASARRAAEKAREQLGDAGVSGAVVFDCVCRKAILGDEFKGAVEAIHDELQAPFAGFETYGEIALEVGEMSGFHNTTSVVVAFPK